MRSRVCYDTEVESPNFLSSSSADRGAIMPSVLNVPHLSKAGSANKGFFNTVSHGPIPLECGEHGTNGRQLHEWNIIFPYI